MTQLEHLLSGHDGENLLTLLSSLCQGSIAIDQQCRIVWMSQQYQQFLQLPADFPTTGELVENILPSTQLPRVVKTGQPNFLDLMQINDQWCAVTRLPLKNPDGSVFGAIGFIDDFRKVTQRSSDGLSGRMKLALQFLIALGAIIWIMGIGYEGYPAGADTTVFERAHQLMTVQGDVTVPFFKDLFIHLSWFYVVFGGIVIVGASNSVNLTDGLDGLAIVPVMIAASCFGLITYLVGNAVFSDYLQLNYVAGTGELAIFCGALMGAGLGFLWYNAPPAMVFMGDTGSLSLGGALGAIAVATKHEIVLGIIGGLFVLEAVSVMIQVASFKLTGKRVFRMAPIHHHFEQLGWKEQTIVIRFWIIAVVLALIGLSTLKLR